MISVCAKGSADYGGATVGIFHRAHGSLPVDTAEAILGTILHEDAVLTFGIDRSDARLVMLETAWIAQLRLYRFHKLTTATIPFAQAMEALAPVHRDRSSFFSFLFVRRARRGAIPHKQDDQEDCKDQRDIVRSLFLETVFNFGRRKIMTAMLASLRHQFYRLRALRARALIMFNFGQSSPLLCSFDHNTGSTPFN